VFKYTHVQKREREKGGTKKERKKEGGKVHDGNTLGCI